jgi:hypothetical protein
MFSWDARASRLKNRQKVNRDELLAGPSVIGCNLKLELPLPGMKACGAS